jgi:xanthine dehydrogenase accessory factor
MKAATLARIAAAQAGRQALVVVTRLADGAQCLVDESGCGGEFALAPGAAWPKPRPSCSPGAAVPWRPCPAAFARAYVPAPRLLIVGAVHIAQALAAWRRRPVTKSR